MVGCRVRAMSARSLLVAVAVVTVLGFGAWMPGFSGPYHFDDAVTPIGDPASQSLPELARHLRQTIRPATKLTYAFEASAGIDGPAERRALNASFHAAAAVLVLLLLARRPGQLPLSVATPIAGLYALHPIHAEAVLSVAGRSASLSTLLLLAGLVMYTRDRRGAAAICYFVAGLARETALVGVSVLIVAELVSSPRRLADHAVRLVPVLVAAVMLAGWMASLPRYRALAEYSFSGRPFEPSVIRQVAAVPIGLSLYARPGALTLDHGEQLPDEPSSPLFIAGLLLFVAAIAGVIVTRRHAPPLVPIGLALWIVAIVPTQSLVPKLDALAERPLTLALAGLLLAIAPLLARLPDRARRASLVGVVVAGALLGEATLARSRLYRSDLLLWQDAADRAPGKARPHLNYAMALIDAGRLEDAKRELRVAAGLDPFDARIARQLAGLEEP